MRYLQSKLASRNSASARGAASEHTVKDDAIFDKYLEKEDDGEDFILPIDLNQSGLTVPRC